MKIIIHDYAAFSFPVQLSRELARKGHDVLHLYSDLDLRGGRLEKDSCDPKTFNIDSVSIGAKYQKYKFIQRAIQERKYSKKLVDRMKLFRPDIIFSCNTSIVISKRILSYAHKLQIRYVHWTQDIYSIAASSILSSRLGLSGKLLAYILKHIEISTINHSDAAIVISEDFTTELKKLNVNPRRVYVIPNWMPLEEMKPEEKLNPWSVRHGLDNTINIMYVGMLGFKHDINLFIGLSKHFSCKPEVRVVVVGAGILFDQLLKEKQKQSLDNMVLLGWQDYKDIAYVLATGDILLALITPDASRFSVPCKVLSYLSAQRPVLAAIPKNNLAHRLLVENNLGLAVALDETNTLLDFADQLVDSSEMRNEMAKRGRAYAEKHFDIKEIGKNFENIITELRDA